MTLTEAPAGIGHNNPPLREALAIAAEALLGEVADVIGEAAKIGAVESDADDIAATKLGVDLTTLLTFVERRRKDEKRAFLDGVTAVDAVFGPPLVKIAAEISRLRTKIGAWKTRKAAEARSRELAVAAAAHAEAERIAAAAAAMRAEGQATALQDTMVEALTNHAAQAEAAAASPPSAATRVVDHVTGLSSSAHKRWGFAVEDIDKVPLEALRAHFTRKDIEGAIGKFVRAHGDAKPLPGVRVYPDSTVHFRKAKGK